MRGRLTYANVMSTIAVFLALGLGGAWAADKLKKNSVSSKQVKNESIVSKDLKNGQAVSGGDVSDGSLGSADLGPGAVGSEEIADGSVRSEEIADGSVGAGDTSREPMHVLGSPGEPALSNGGEGDCIFRAFFSPEEGYNPVGYYRDAAGIVHLTGTFQKSEGPGGDGACTLSSGNRPESVEDTTAFILPPGFRPDLKEDQWVNYRGESTGLETSRLIEIVGDEPSQTSFGTPLAPGTVWFPTGVEDGPLVSLDGISFRAAP